MSRYYDGGGIATNTTEPRMGETCLSSLICRMWSGAEFSRAPAVGSRPWARKGSRRRHTQLAAKSSERGERLRPGEESMRGTLKPDLGKSRPPQMPCAESWRSDGGNQDKCARHVEFNVDAWAGCIEEAHEGFGLGADKIKRALKREETREGPYPDVYKWPTQGGKLKSEFATDGIVGKALPTVLPYGSG